jgi:NIPSNAP protein
MALIGKITFHLLAKGKRPMQRREFLAASTATTVGLIGSKPNLAADERQGRQFFELRIYHFASPANQEGHEQFLSQSAIPAFNRAGIGPVGVFRLIAVDNPGMKLTADSTDLYVLLPHNSIESVIDLEGRLAADEPLQKSGQTVLNAPKSDPAYTRYESTLLHAMEGFPQVQVPSKVASRVIELRTYESHNNERAKNKLDMFNAGEFQIFARAGMPGVFFGGAIVGSHLPQLTYMVVHPVLEDAQKNWKTFGQDPEWKKLISNPGYQDNVSKVTALFIRPAAGSQI